MGELAIGLPHVGVVDCPRDAVRDGPQSYACEKQAGGQPKETNGRKSIPEGWDEQVDEKGCLANPAQPVSLALCAVQRRNRARGSNRRDGHSRHPLDGCLLVAMAGRRGAGVDMGRRVRPFVAGRLATPRRTESVAADTLGSTFGLPALPLRGWAEDVGAEVVTRNGVTSRVGNPPSQLGTGGLMAGGDHVERLRAAARLAGNEGQSWTTAFGRPSHISRVGRQVHSRIITESVMDCQHRFGNFPNW